MGGDAQEAGRAEDAAAATKRREAAAAAAACGGCRNLDRTEERALFAQPAAETLKGAQLAVERGERMFHEGRLERAIQWYEKALVAYDYAFPEDGETQAAIRCDAARRFARFGSRLPRSEAVSGGPPELPGNPSKTTRRGCWRREPAASSICSTRRGRLSIRIDAPRERALLKARERAYATNSKVVSKRIVDRKPSKKLQKGASCLHQSRPASATS